MTTDEKIDPDAPRDWYFTFGFGGPNANKYLKLNGTLESTRFAMMNRFGSAWAFQYPSAEAAGVDKFKLTELVQPVSKLPAGPWEAMPDTNTNDFDREEGVVNYEVLQINQRGMAEQVIAKVRGGEDNEECKVLALAIAAVPEMFTQLQVLLGAVEDLDHRGHYTAELILARAVVKLATEGVRHPPLLPLPNPPP